MEEVRFGEGTVNLHAKFNTCKYERKYICISNKEQSR